VKNLSDPMATRPSLTDQLKGKSRRRRDDLDRMAYAVPSPLARRNDLLPRLNLAHIPVGRLRMSAREVRKFDPAHVREVANSISALGFCAPILVGKDDLVLDGAARVQAARLLGLDRAPCIRIEHLSENEQRVLRLAVNRLGETGRWSLDALKIEFEELILAASPIEISGFTLGEIDQIVLARLSRVRSSPKPMRSPSLASATFLSSGRGRGAKRPSGRV
jgi:hypothetical protein